MIPDSEQDIKPRFHKSKTHTQVYIQSQKSQRPHVGIMGVLFVNRLLLFLKALAKIGKQ